MKPLTTKQSKLMKVILKGNIDVKGNWVSWCDYKQILDRLSYETSRESLMCSIAILRKQGWVERDGKELRVGRVRQTVAPTALAVRLLNPSAAPKPVSAATIEENLFDGFVEVEI